MIQSTVETRSDAPLHVAIIMDGNGRWAEARGLPRLAGHRAGADAVRRTVEAAPGLGIGTLTLYAFSADNWRRPLDEVRGLMDLLLRYLRGEVGRLREHGVRLRAIGRRDRLSLTLREAIARAESATAAGETLALRLAIDYSARDAILHAARQTAPSQLDDREAFRRRLAEAYGESGTPPDVDLLIRAGGERRLSDFLLWESAYAELHFTSRMWPDFEARDLAAAVAEFQGRARRFGALPGRLA